MAGLNREQNYEVKYLRKVLSEVDGRIELPDSLKGASLLAKIEDVTPAPEPVTTATLLKPRRWFTWQSTLTYAAVFALLVGLFYGLGFHNSSGGLLEGELIIDEDTADQPMDGAVYDDALDIPEAANVAEAPDMGGDAANVTTGGAGETESPATGGMRPADVELPEADPDNTPSPRNATGLAGDAVPSVGGGETVLLSTIGGYTYTYRVNDRSDAASVDAPITLEILSLNDDSLLAQLDLPMYNIRFHCADSADNALALGGENDGGLMIYTLDISDPGNPVVRGSYEQSGRYVSANLYKDYIRVATYAGSAQGLQIPSEDLPGYEGGGACILTAINLSDFSSAQKAFLGAGEDIKLYNISAYVTYDSPDESGRIAHITLEGLEMQVGSVA